MKVKSVADFCDAVTVCESFSQAGVPTPTHAALLSTGEVKLCHAVSENDLLLFDRWQSSHIAGHLKLCAWRCVNGVPAVFISTSFNTDLSKISDSLETVLCVVEVREQFRGKQLAMSTVEVLQRYSNHVIHSSGQYTPEGFRSLAGKLPYLQEVLARRPHLAVKPDVKRDVLFCDASFVDDWDRLVKNGAV